jgi:hypothetical protein
LIDLESVEAMEDNLRAEYDLKRLQVRKLGFARKRFGGVDVDVVKMISNTETINEGFTVSDESAAE